PANRFETINCVAILVFVYERGVASFLRPASNLINGVVPGDVLPISRTRSSYLRFQQTALINDVLLKRRAFRTECAAIDWMIRITLDMHDLRNRVFGFVAE